MEDHQIITLFFERDERAIHETDLKYGRLCHHISRQILEDEEDVKECVNDTYLSLWNRIPPTRPNHFPAFITKIVRNLSFDKLKYVHAKKRALSVQVPLEELEQVLSDSQGKNVTEMELGWLINDFLKLEKPEARQVFLRRYLFFDTIEEIAARFGFRESKVKSMLSRTRNRLREYLKKEGVEI